MEHRNQELKTIHWRKKIIMKIYTTWEHIYHVTHGLKPIHEEDLLMFKIKTYKGETLALSDGEFLKDGDEMLELHFNNDLLLHTSLTSKNTMHTITTLLHMMKATFKRMRTYVDQPEYKNVKALYGVSLFHRGAKQFGFDILELPEGSHNRFQRFYLRMIMAVMHPNGRERLKSHSSMLSPKILVVSKQHFLQTDKEQQDEQIKNKNS